MSIYIYYIYIYAPMDMIMRTGSLSQFLHWHSPLHLPRHSFAWKAGALGSVAIVGLGEVVSPVREPW